MSVMNVRTNDFSEVMLVSESKNIQLNHIHK